MAGVTDASGNGVADGPRGNTPVIPQVIVRSVTEFLRRHAPYNEMDDASLELFAGGARLAYFARGSLIVGPSTGVADTLYVIQRGTVQGKFVSQPAWHDALEYSAGETFPISAVLGRRASTADYHAVEDCFCYAIGIDTVEELLERSPPFQRYCTRHIDALLRQAYQRVSADWAGTQGADHAMLTPLSQVVKRSAVTCAGDTPLREALAQMQRLKVSSIVITRPSGEALGIFTERDLLRHTVAGAVDADAPIAGYMTPGPIGLPAVSTVAEAALAMARHGIRHLLVFDQGRVAGVVSERALFAFQRLTMRQVGEAIDAAEDAASFRAAADGIRELAATLTSQGLGAEPLTRLISALNDRFTRRVVAVESARHRLAGEEGPRWCWLALGSEGRHEQTISTDQDNALIFEAGPGETEALRNTLLGFAQAVNDALDAAGYPLCRGGIMAGNPMWCLSADEWRERFGGWVRNSTPEALLHANIFFDFRPLAGEEGLAAELRVWLTKLVQGNERFLRMMAANALESRPPLGFFGDIVAAGEGNTVDLKSQGTRVFVDAARIFALAAGVEAQNTAERLRLAADTLRVPSGETEAAVSAFYYLLLLRLRGQGTEDAGAQAEGKRISPAALNELDRRILKEAFLQGRKLQQRLALDYGL